MGQASKNYTLESLNRVAIRSNMRSLSTAINNSVYIALCKQKAGAALVCVAVQWPTPQRVTMECVKKL